MHCRDTHIDPGKQHIFDPDSPHTRAMPTRNVPAVTRRPGDSRNHGLNRIQGQLRRAEKPHARRGRPQRRNSKQTARRPDRRTFEPIERQDYSAQRDEHTVPLPGYRRKASPHPQEVASSFQDVTDHVACQETHRSPRTTPVPRNSAYSRGRGPQGPALLYARRGRQHRPTAARSPGRCTPSPVPLNIARITDPE